jgi:hypothetical protein
MCEIGSQNGGDSICQYLHLDRFYFPAFWRLHGCPSPGGSLNLDTRYKKMRPLLSEFSYGYALTEELASGTLGSLIGAPIFPSLIQEGQVGGGYDLQLPIVGAPLFLQFKLSDRMVYRSAAEWHLFNTPYYRMHLRPARHSDQHALLQALESSGEEVYYVAPYFHTTEELNVHYSYRTVADNSVWFRPSDIGTLPDNDDHYLTFETSTAWAYFCSEEPRKLDTKRSKEGVRERLSEAYERRKDKLDQEFFRTLADEILEISRDSKESAIHFDTDRFRTQRRRNRKQEAQFAAFLSRSVLNAELIIVSERSQNVEE